MTASGHVDGLPRSRKLYHIILDEYLARKQPRTVAEMLTELRRLGVPSQGPAPAVNVEQTAGKVYRIEQIVFESEPGVTVTRKLYVPNAAGRKSAVVLVEEKRLPVPLHVTRSASTAALSEAIAQSGRVVLELEPRDSPLAQ